MIIDMRTYRLKPRSIGPAERALGAALPARNRLSPLGGAWHVDTGPLNRVITVWPYADEAEKARVEAEAAQSGAWPPPDLARLMVGEDSTLLAPAPFSPPFEPRDIGPVYEMRIYTYTADSIPLVIERWQEKLAGRLRLSPLVGAWHTVSGPARQWIHVWAYRDGAERHRIREEASALGVWPPETHDWSMMLHQENMLLAPADFSPLK